MKYLNFNYFLKNQLTKFYRFTGLNVEEFLILKEKLNLYNRELKLRDYLILIAKELLMEAGNTI